MNTPNFQQLVGIPIVDAQGHPTSAFMLVMSQLFNELQQNLSQEGFVVPSQTTDNLSVIEGNVKANNGIARFVYDSTTGKMKVNNNGVFKEIVTL